MRKFITIIIIVFAAGGIVSAQTLGFTGKKNSAITVSPAFIKAFGKLGEMTEPGFGSIVSYTHYNIFFSNAFAGIQTGCYNLSGKVTSDGAARKVDSILMVPVLGNFGYRFFLSRHFSVSPSVSLGTSYFNARYSGNSSGDAEIEDADGSSNFVEFDMKTGVNLMYTFQTGLFVGISSDGGMLIEKGEATGYVTGNVILGFRF